MTLESKKNWVFPEAIPKALMKKVFGDFSPVESTLLFNRGLVDREKIDFFFSEDLNKVPDYTHLQDTKSAVALIKDAVKNNKKVFIHGDFDVDGVCATAILWQFLHDELPKRIDKEVDVMPYIPDRIDEGYGLTNSSVDAMIEKGAQLIISVDCGVRDMALIKKYRKQGELEFIVTDHHQPPDDIAENLDYPLVHQMHPAGAYPFDKICGATVAFLLAQALRAEFGIDHQLTKETPGLDLVALATVADMMPLTEINRILVSNGIKQMQQGKRLGLKLLVETVNVRSADIDSYHLGFIIGPRINAAGRIGSAMDALRLMVTDNLEGAKKLAASLNSLNIQRQGITTEILAQVKANKTIFSPENKLIFASGEHWPEGVVGLVAGKLLEEYGRPSIVVTINNGEIRGSARSIPNFNITSAIEKFAPHLERYGGHAQAAGFTVKQGELDLFHESLVTYANSLLSDSDLKQELGVDAILSTDDLTLGMIEALNKFKPFGYGNRKPVFALREVVVVDKKVMGSGGNHMRLSFKGDGVGISQAVMFDCLEDVTKINSDDMIDVVGSLDINEWNGNTNVQFQVKEWRRSNP